MTKKNDLPKDEIVVKSALLSDKDERLEKLFDELESGSLETLENAARQIIALSTTLLGAFFGLLALKDAPAYLGFLEIKIIGTGALLAFLAALFFALRAISPKRYIFSHSSLTEKRKVLKDMLELKQDAVHWASKIFGLGALLMLATALDIFLFRL